MHEQAVELDLERAKDPELDFSLLCARREARCRPGR
jgi:hypothetical protein